MVVNRQWFKLLIKPFSESVVICPCGKQNWSHHHPLLEKEKHLDAVARRILPKHIADTVCLKGSRLAHLYGLPKTHKERLAMRPILSATGTYNYTLAKWLDLEVHAVTDTVTELTCVGDVLSVFVTSTLLLSSSSSPIRCRGWARR